MLGRSGNDFSEKVILEFQRMRKKKNWVKVEENTAGKKESTESSSVLTGESMISISTLI